MLSQSNRRGRRLDQDDLGEPSPVGPRKCRPEPAVAERRAGLIVDAGPLYAAAATGDRNHGRCVELLSGAERPLVIPELVVTEVTYLLADRIGPQAELAFLSSVARGEIVVEPVL